MRSSGPTTSAAKVSKGIRFATGSDIPRAMVCVDGYSVVDATAEGVQARNMQRLFIGIGIRAYFTIVRRSSKPLVDAVFHVHTPAYRHPVFQNRGDENEA